MLGQEIDRDECRDLIKQLSDKYGLNGLILDLTNGWVLRDANGAFIASGNDRIPSFLCERAYKKTVHCNHT